MSATVQRTPSICELRLERDVGGEHQAEPSRPPGEQDDVVERRVRRSTRSTTATLLPRLTVLRSGGGAALAHEARPVSGRWRPVGALQAVDLDHDAVVELEQAQLPESDLGQHPRGGDVLDPAAPDQLVEAAASEGLVAARESPPRWRCPAASGRAARSSRSRRRRRASPCRARRATARRIRASGTCRPR